MVSAYSRLSSVEAGGTKFRIQAAARLDALVRGFSASVLPAPGIRALVVTAEDAVLADVEPTSKANVLSADGAAIPAVPAVEDVLETVPASSAITSVKAYQLRAPYGHLRVMVRASKEAFLNAKLMLITVPALSTAGVFGGIMLLSALYIPVLWRCSRRH